MKNLILILILAASFAACQKDDSPTLEIFNNSDNNYKIENANIQIGIATPGTTTIQIDEGINSLRATQTSGYIFSPTIVGKTINAQKAETYYWTIP